MGTQKVYSKEFKERAVKLVLEQGMTNKQVAIDLGVPPIYISHWKSNYLKQRIGLKTEKPLTLDEASRRISELERELMIAKEEAEILKKAVGFFAKK